MNRFGNLLSLINEPLANITVMAEVMDAALEAVDPGKAVRRSLTLGRDQVIIGTKAYDLAAGSKVKLVAIGKASEAMCLAALQVLGERVTTGICVLKYPEGLLDSFPQVRTIKGDHPVPGAGSLEAGRAIQELLKDLTSDDLVIVLISGGGSALATLPDDSISLDEMQRMTGELLKGGRTIGEINTLRKHLDLLKGGGLLRMAQPARVASLILSDVIGDPLNVIASGPTVPDPTTFQQAMDILKQSDLSSKEVPNIWNSLRAGCEGRKPETIKQDEPGILPADNLVIGSNAIACRAAQEKAAEHDLHAEVVTTSLQGEAREVGKQLAEYARERESTGIKGVAIFGGETTVTVHGSGLGGRNLEVALGALNGMAGLGNSVLVTLATDGDDGSSQAAGAVVSGRTAARALQLGLEPAAYLAENDSAHFFSQLGNLLVTGPTGTNVNDITLLFNL